MTPVNYVKKVFLQGKYIEIHFYYIENVLPQTEDNSIPHIHSYSHCRITHTSPNMHVFKQ